MEHSANSEGTEIGGNKVLVSRKKIKTSAAGFVQQEDTCNFSLEGGKKTAETHWLWNVPLIFSKWINFTALGKGEKHAWE